MLIVIQQFLRDHTIERHRQMSRNGERLLNEELMFFVLNIENNTQ